MLARVGVVELTRISSERDRGAAAVEFALVAFLLITILFLIIEGGRLFMLQANLSAAAREAAREVALSEIPDVQKRLDEAFTWGATLVQVDGCDLSSGTYDAARVTATYSTNLVGPLWPGEIKLTGEGVMRCGG